MKKFLLIVFVLFLFVFMGLWKLSMTVSTMPEYEHPASVRFFETGIMDAGDYTGPHGSDIIPLVSVRRLSKGYKIGVIFLSKTAGREVVLKTVGLKSKRLNLTRQINEPLRLDKLDKGFYDAYKVVFDGLDEANFPRSVKNFDLIVNYEIDGRVYDVEFDVIRREIGVPIH